MSIVNTHSLTPPPFRDDVVNETEVVEGVKRYLMSRPWVKWLLLVQTHETLITVDTTAGPVVAILPFAAQNPGVEFEYVKISADANLLSVTRSGTDLINGAASQNVGNAQYNTKSFRSDGVSNWYIV